MKNNFNYVSGRTISRTNFNFDHDVRTTMTPGYLYPIDVLEVLPGDVFKGSITTLSRLTSAFIKPPMTDLFLSVYCFYVRNRDIFSDTEGVYGDTNPSAYSQNNLKEYPHTTSPQTCYINTIPERLHIPPGHVPAGVNIMPIRAFAKIYNDYFRNQNTNNEVYVQRGNIDVTEVFNNNDFSETNYFGKFPKVCKMKDYFTSALPSPQKGEAVTIPLGDTAQVVSTGSLKFEDGDAASGSSNELYLNTGENSYSGESHKGAFFYSAPDTSIGSYKTLSYKDGLQVDLSSATASNVNNLRFAFALQRMQELDARMGSRFVEYLAGHFNVYLPELQAGRAKVLGGSVTPLNVQQVAQTSKAEDGAPLGDLGAYSMTAGKSGFFLRASEPGYLITVACIRYKHNYCSGIPKMYSRYKKTDFYDPLFSHLGEQPIYQSELKVTEEMQNLKEDDKIFGYNEYGSDYRYATNKISGELRPGQALDIWNIVDNYSNAPTISKEFVEEDTTGIDQITAVSSSQLEPYIVDFYYKMNAIRNVTKHSVPGLIDH